MLNTEVSLPMLLTCIRLIGSPIILPFLLVYLLPYNIFWINCSIAAIFILFGLTDFFDGYLARKYHLVTATGAMLDHVADKFLLYSTLVALIAAHKLYFFWAIIWIGRELFIMSLRQIALENNFTLTVSSYGKIKTVVQMSCLVFIILNPHHSQPLTHLCWNGIELFLLLLGTALSVGSAYNYFSVFMKQFNKS